MGMAPASRLVRTQSQGGGGGRRGRDRNNATRGAADNDRKLGCRHDDDDNCDGHPPIRILASPLSLVVDDDDAAVMTRMGV